MNMTLNGIDILIGRGPTRDMVEQAALDVLGVRIKEVITDRDGDRLIEVDPGGLWVRTMRLDDEDVFGCKLDIDAFGPTDFRPVLGALQARLCVDLAVADEESPLPEDVLIFRIDGRIDRAKLAG